MDTNTRSQYTEIQDEHWKSHGYTDPQRDESAGTPLDTDIHPMFSFELDRAPPTSNDKRRWSQLTLSDYNLIRPVLRYTSAMLQSPQSENVIYFVVYGKRYIPKDLPMRKGLPIFEFHRHEVDRSIIHREVQEVLKKLAEIMRFYVSDEDVVTTQLSEGISAKTAAGTIHYPEGINITTREDKKGPAPFTVIHGAYLSNLKRLLLDPAQNKFKILKLQFEMSVTFCHELIHAINYAIDLDLLKFLIKRGPSAVGEKVDYNEPLYAGQRAAELGFFWENEVLGGSITGSRIDDNMPVTINEWPTFEKRDPENPDPERAGPAPFSTSYLVSAYYIQNVQSQEFWDFFKQEHPDDHHALRIRKSVGTFKVYGNERDDYDRNWVPAGSIEFKWTPAPSTLRVLRDDGDASVCGARANETPDERTTRLAAAQPPALPVGSQSDARYLEGIDR